MVRHILGSVAQFEKASLVAKLRGARERIIAATGKCGGRNPMLFGEALAMARRLYRKNAKTGDRRSLRAIAVELAEAGHVNSATKKPFSAEAIRLAMLPRDAASVSKAAAPQEAA